MIFELHIIARLNVVHHRVPKWNTCDVQTRLLVDRTGEPVTTRLSKSKHVTFLFRRNKTSCFLSTTPQQLFSTISKIAVWYGNQKAVGFRVPNAGIHSFFPTHLGHRADLQRTPCAVQIPSQAGERKNGGFLQDKKCGGAAGSAVRV